MKQASTKNQAGSSHLAIVLMVVVLTVVGVVGWTVYKKSSEKPSAPGEISASTPKIKNLGIDLDYYDSSTKMAGAILFTNLPAVAGGLEAPFLEYGRQVPATSAGPARLNPQPTFIAPLGNPVKSLIDGEVVAVEKLYSNDYSIHTQPKGSDLIFELEHVINVKVQVGDSVKAGQVVAEVSDYDSKNLGGLGLVEIGVLIPGNPPKHACTFDYLDDSIKEETLKKIRNLQDSWEVFSGNNSFYNQEAEPIAGCATRDAVEG